MGGLDSQTLRAAYAGTRVLITGHTGFKGGWLAVWLRSLDAEVTGFALPPPTDPSLFLDAGIESTCRSVIGDVRDLGAVRALVREVRPAVVFHLAAQPLVRVSYDEPLLTLDTNVMGTATVLEAVRLERGPCAVVVVTSDKCYEPRECPAGYREDHPMGGHDPYSMSKGAAELVAASWRRSFFRPELLAAHGVALASARAGNVIGGGDWARDRIVPDAVRALSTGLPIPVRNPRSVRPWQHVLEPLSGYLLLGARLHGIGTAARAGFCEAWNFGPAPASTRPVSAVVGAIVDAWGAGRWEETPREDSPHESAVLRLAVDKASARLGWAPRWSLSEAVGRTVAWYRARAEGASPPALRGLMLRQIAEYLEAA